MGKDKRKATSENVQSHSNSSKVRGAAPKNLPARAAGNEATKSSSTRQTSAKVTSQRTTSTTSAAQDSDSSDEEDDEVEEDVVRRHNSRKSTSADEPVDDDCFHTMEADEDVNFPPAEMTPMSSSSILSDSGDVWFLGTIRTIDVARIGRIALSKMKNAIAGVEFLQQRDAFLLIMLC